MTQARWIVVHERDGRENWIRATEVYRLAEEYGHDALMSRVHEGTRIYLRNGVEIVAQEDTNALVSHLAIADAATDTGGA